MGFASNCQLAQTFGWGRIIRRARGKLWWLAARDGGGRKGRNDYCVLESWDRYPSVGLPC